ncbi:hypothetical protein CHUAL_014221 [Chamberlinius hualienensis]
MASIIERTNMPLKIDSRFTEGDLNDIFTFTFENNKKKSAKCNVEHRVNDISQRCNFEAIGTSVVKKFNLWRHVKRNHTEVYETLVRKKNEEDNAAGRKRPQENVCSTSYNKKLKTTKPKRNLKSLKSSKITITLDAETFRNGLADMVCLSLTPLATFNQKGFQKIAGEIAGQLGVSTEQDAICQLVINRGESARNDLKKTLSGKLCYLKMDAATRGSRNYLAVNVQFYDKRKNKAIVKTLDIVDTEGHNGSPYVKAQVKAILDKFEINETQVLSICIDNAANMPCAVNSFTKSKTDSVNITRSISVDDEVDMDDTEQWIEDPRLILPAWIFSDDSKVQMMRCGIHTLQLAIQNGLKEQYAADMLAQIRQIVLKLQTPSIRNVLLELYGPTKSPDTITRWGSTFALVDQLLVFQDYCEKVSAPGTSELYLSKGKWDEVKKLRDLLSKLNDTAITLQGVDVTPGIIMKEWHKLLKHLEHFDGQVSAGILSSMKNRENVLFENSHFLAGVYVDPRYRILLSPHHITNAKAGLLDIFRRLQNQNILQQLNGQSSTNEPVQSLEDPDSSEDDEFEKELDRLEKRQKVVELHHFYDEEQEFYEDCNTMEGMGRLKVKSVFEAINFYPEKIQTACHIASSMPTTQASVERLFSALKLILSERRQMMKDDLLSAILFCNINNDDDSL